MRKKFGKRIFSFILSLMMVLVAMCVGGVEEYKAAAAEDVELKNADFSNDLTDWTKEENDSTSSWIYMTDYDTAYATKPDGTTNDKIVKFESAGEAGIHLKQTIAVLPAGTYTVSVPVMGGSASITIGLNGEYSDTSYLADVSGWNVWYTKTYTFTVDEEIENAVLDISIYCWAGGYGFFDRVDFAGTTNEGYKFTMTADNEVVEKGGTVTLTPSITYNRVAVADLSTLTWSVDNTSAIITDNGDDTVTITLPKTGKYNVTAKYMNVSGNVLCEKTIMITATEPDADFVVVLTGDNTTVDKDGTVKLTAKVTRDDVEVTDLEAEGYKLWFWTDNVAEGHEDGMSATFSNYDNNSGYSLTADAKLPKVGNYYVYASLEDANGNILKEGLVTLVAKEVVATSEDDKETEEVVNIELVNADFSTSPTGTWTGEVTSGWIEGNSMDVVSYSTDAWLQLPSYVGTTGLKFSMNHGETMTISQWLTELPAGTYTITAPVMGENTDIYLVLGDQEVKATSLSGYNNWSKAKATFTITEDMTDVKVGFKLVAKSSGSNYSWGWIDSISLVKGVPATGDTTNVMGFVALMVTGAALVAYTSVKRRKVNF